MMMKLTILCFVLLWTNCYCQENDNNNDINVGPSTLEQVEILIENSFQTPKIDYPTATINSQNYWNKYGGLDQAITSGLREAREFGKRVYRRYTENSNFNINNLLANRTYLRSQYNVYSKSEDKYDQTAQAFISGVLEANEQQRVEINWQPVPIRHFVDTDYVKVIADKACPRVAEIWQETQDNDDEFSRIQTEQQDLINRLKAGSSLTTLSLGQLSELPKILRIIEKERLVDLPVWARNTDNRFDADIVELERLENYLRFKNVETAKLTAGGVLNIIKDKINDKVLRNTPNKMNVYTAGDAQVKGLATILNGNQSATTAYGFNSAILFELRSRANSNYFVRAFIKRSLSNNNDNRYTFEPYPIQGCGLDCPVDKFNEIISDNIWIPQSYFDNCRRNGAIGQQLTAITIISSVLSTLFLIGY